MVRLHTGPTHPWHIPAGSRPGAGFALALDPGDTVLQWSGLSVIELQAGESHTFATRTYERAVVPAGGAVTVKVDGKRFELRDRSHVFHSVSDWCYLPIDTEVKISSTTGATVAIASAIADKRFDAVMMPAESVPVELRGSGQSSRQLNNFMAPEVFDGAHRLMCVEVITPDGNWSSYPPHRHDGEPDAEGNCVINNEEIYWFRVGNTSKANTYTPDGFAMHRTYTTDGEVDVNVAVYDGDVFTIPRGYHGPCVAAPGYPLYYLNVLAGPTAERTMAFCDDPTHHWVRDSWANMTMDPRLPMTSALGPTGIGSARTSVPK
jgi:5-deoxy-glucuronate isomerase